MEQKPIQLLINKILQSVSRSLIDNTRKVEYMENLTSLDINFLETSCQNAEETITNLDMKYIICFVIEMDVKDISLLFNVEPASVRTVRYRIRKKFGDENRFKLLI